MERDSQNGASHVAKHPARQRASSGWRAKDMDRECDVKGRLIRVANRPFLLHDDWRRQIDLI